MRWHWTTTATTTLNDLTLFSRWSGTCWRWKINFRCVILRRSMKIRFGHHHMHQIVVVVVRMNMETFMFSLWLICSLWFIHFLHLSSNEQLGQHHVPSLVFCCCCCCCCFCLFTYHRHVWQWSRLSEVRIGDVFGIEEADRAQIALNCSKWRTKSLNGFHDSLWTRDLWLIGNAIQNNVDRGPFDLIAILWHCELPSTSRSGPDAMNSQKWIHISVYLLTLITIQLSCYPLSLFSPQKWSVHFSISVLTSSRCVSGFEDLPWDTECTTLRWHFARRSPDSDEGGRGRSARLINKVKVIYIVTLSGQSVLRCFCNHRFCLWALIRSSIGRFRRINWWPRGGFRLARLWRSFHCGMNQIMENVMASKKYHIYPR